MLNKIIEQAQPLIKEMERRSNADNEGYYLYGLIKGRKYVKIVSGTNSQFNPDGSALNRVAGFIDQDGNILFAASWNAPAKGPSAVRGNLNVNNGFDALDDKGNIRYLRGW